MCLFFIAGSALWLGQYTDSTQILFIPYESTEQFNPYFNAFIVFFTYIIIFQVSNITAQFLPYNHSSK